MTNVFQPRIVEISVGTAGAPGRTWGTNIQGTIPLRCFAKVDLTASSKPNQAVAKLWNLSANSIKALEYRNQVLIVRAGEGVASQIFAGDIPKGGVTTTRNGPDRITEVRAKTGGRVWREAMLSKSYPAGMSRLVAINDAARAMGLGVGYVGPSFVDIVFPSPWAFVGKARTALDRLVAMTLGAWWCQIGKLAYIIGPLDLLPGNAPVVGPLTGLHGSPKRTTKGVEFTSRYNPGFLGGGPVVLQTFDVTGAYKLKSVTHEVNNWSGQWTSKCKTEAKAI